MGLLMGLSWKDFERLVRQDDLPQPLQISAGRWLVSDLDDWASKPPLSRPQSPEAKKASPHSHSICLNNGLEPQCQTAATIASYRRRICSSYRCHPNRESHDLE